MLADDIFEVLFLQFASNIRLDVSCILYTDEMICVNVKASFLGKM